MYYVDILIFPSITRHFTQSYAARHGTSTGRKQVMLLSMDACWREEQAIEPDERVWEVKGDKDEYYAQGR